MLRSRAPLPSVLALFAVLGCAAMDETSREGVRLEMYAPTGAVEVTRLHAPRLSDLDGATLCELSDHMWEHQRTFPLLRDGLAEAYPGVAVVPYSEFPDVYGADPDTLAAAVRSEGCDGAIVGNAG